MRAFLLGLIWIYRRTLSPVLGARCRFEPSCSAYAEEAIHAHGALRGGLLALWRLLRCQPFARGGIDPVPRPRSPRLAE
ncbi:MAG TPA: membrane protein insertion efficiency factor YidD [Polyangia bacterium]